MRVIILLLLLTRIAAAQSQPARPEAMGDRNGVDSQALSLPKKEDWTSLPLGKGLPVLVRTGLYFQSIKEFDENDGHFSGTVDMRLRWNDSRLSYPAETTPRGYQEFRGPDADKKITEIWVPEVAFINLKDSPSYRATNLRIFPDGQVELMQRTTGQFVVPIDASDFPFDKQILGVEIVMRRETSREASLVVLQDDLDFSLAAKDTSVDGWTLGHVNVKRVPYEGWYGASHSGVVVELDVTRHYGTVVPTVFIPLLASLLIPMLAIWMNRTEAGEFQVDAFDLGNVIVGGLFAIIALNFTIDAAYKSISSGDNTVTRLFALNYATLAVGLVVVIFLYRYNMPMRLGSRHIQEQVFRYLSWAVPVLVFGTALAFIFVAMS